ncbi:MAG: hypothetical protein ACOC0O_06690 [Spirochaetota bacterium]
MTIYVVTDSRTVRKAFASAERSRTYSVEYAPQEEIGEVVSRAQAVPDSFVYFDTSGMNDRAVKRRLTRLRETRPYRYGIVDPKDEIADVVHLFHSAAADYLNRALLAEGVSTARLRRVVEYEPVPLGRRGNNHIPDHERGRVIPSGNDWSGICDGEEYTFLMLYAALDHSSDLRRKSSEGLLAAMRRSFVSLLEHYFADYHARVWMWKEDEGLLLMPFDGRQVDAIVPALRLHLDRVLINAEQLAQYGLLSWRLALHLGNTTYRSSGRTGSIVSESVNFMFHFGSRFVEPGGLAVTASVHDLMPDRVRPLLNHRGEFESIHVYTLRDLV